MDDGRENIGYIIQNLRATYGEPKLKRERDPLDELIRTILSQSTTDVNTDRAFAGLKARFPTWEQARRARASSIEKAIRSGGLSRQKSVRIKEILNEIHRRRGNLDLSFLCRISLEEAVEFLSSFKGVGPKTVACTLLFSCKKHKIFPLDVHIFRICRRLGLIPQKCSDEYAHQLMTELVPKDKHTEAHINLIRHGRKICRPNNPRCDQCCLIDYCQYAREMLRS